MKNLKSAESGDLETRVLDEIKEAFTKLDVLLKHGDTQQILTLRGINSSLAMLIVDGLKAYLLGHKEQAIEDLSLASEEIAQRYAQHAKGKA